MLSSTIASPVLDIVTGGVQFLFVFNIKLTIYKLEGSDSTIHSRQHVLINHGNLHIFTHHRDYNDLKE